MPEIKNTFLQGKMNKDLDERLIPNGQYRHAMNVEVSTSEGSDIGTVKNILGNQRVDQLDIGSDFKCVGSIADEKNNKLYWFVSKYNVDAILEYDADNDISKYVLVDIYAGTSKAVLKFFGNVITGINIIDNLLFWTDNQGEPKKINIDTCKAGTTSIDTHTQLSFENGSFHGTTVRSYMNPATSGRYFYYPREKFFKTINTWTYSPSNSSNDTVMRSSIRHYRNGEFLGAYDINFFNSTNWPNPDNDPNVLNRYTSSSINYVENGNFPGIIPYESGGYPSNGTHGRRIWGEGSDEDFFEGDVIFGDNVTIDIAEKHVTVIKPKPLNAPTVKINHTESTQSTSKIPNLFETKFPRFSYRYKYRDGEYSTFAPFTEPVFNAKYTKDTSKSIDGGVMYNQDTAYDIKEPYNKAMVNAIHSVDLTDFITAQTPEDVVEIDILYKQENSSVIYSIDTIKHVDSEWHDWSNSEGINIGYGKALENDDTYAATGGLTGGKYVVTTENIYAALPANQLLRPWDNVPRKALAQEVTGNRIVYGNYLQNYDIGSKPQVQVSYGNRQNRLGSFDSKGLPSIKSQRNYQLGVVYCDKYGRETPVFTSNTGAVNIPWQDSSGKKNASKSTQLTVGAVNNFPEWVDSLKFFVKETSNEYYNLTMERAWVTKSTYELDNSEGHLWISFPSSDRNKISEEDYIILKKKIGVGEEQVTFENKFKIVDIKNEAPDAIKYELVNIGVARNSANAGWFTSSANVDPLFTSSDKRPDKQTNLIQINHDSWKREGGTNRGAIESINSPNADGTGDMPLGVKDLYISWSRFDSTGGMLASKKYKVVSGFKSAASYFLKLSTEITKIDADIADIDGISGSGTSGIHADLMFQIEKKELKDTEDFSGKFFVKISKNQVSSIIETGKEVSNLDKYQVTAKQGVWYWHDDIMTVQGSPVVGDDNYGLTNFYGYDPNHSYSTANPDVPNHIHMNYTDSSGNINATADTSYDGQSLRISDWWEVWNGIRDELNGKPRFFVDAMHMIAGQSEASDYAKYCCVTWSGCTKDDDGDTPENSAWSYPPLKTWLSEFGDTSNLITPVDEVETDDGVVQIIPATSSWYENNLISTSPLLNANEDYEGLKVDGWVGPLQNVSRDLLIGNPAINNHINGLEGLVTTNEYHATGPRRWFSGLNGTDYGVGDDTKTYSDNGEEDRHFMHLSFFAPGKDLHDGSWDLETNTSMLYGEGAFMNNLQGIWGGGVFTGEAPSEKFGVEAIGHQHLPMEGNYDDNLNYLPEPPGPGVGYGYDLDYRERHERQWDPTFLHRADGAFVGDPGNTIRDFIRNLYPGSKFRFNKNNSDVSANNVIDDAVYTIKKVTIKKLYNHTSWRKPYNRYIANEGYDIETTQNLAYQSVEEAGLRWLDTVPDGGADSNGTDALSGIASPGFGDSGFISKIEQFGASHNRRLCYIIELDKNPHHATGNQMGSPLNMNTGGVNGMSGDLANNDYMDVEFLDPVQDLLLSDLSKFPAIWEVDPKKQEVDLDIYYEASNSIPVRINERTNELFAPIGCKVEIINATPQQALNDVYLESWDGNTAIFNPGFNRGDGNNEIDYTNTSFKFIREDGSYTVAEAGGQQLTGDQIGFKPNFLFKEDIGDVIGAGLAWYNCFSFGNGLESNRIRDDFNEMFITNGVKASTTTQQTYEEERRSHGLIYSGIYNSNSGINDLNQFIMAEKITKDLNPTYGSIQKLFQRRISLIAFCEDRVIQIISNKDAIFNADGNPQLISSSNVLGDANPFVGNFGISKNPESFASESYRAYFTDKARGAVLRLSKDGLTPISKVGMHDWFRDNLPIYTSLIGTYDSYKENYNITLSNTYTENIIFNSAFGQGVGSTEVDITNLNVIDNGLVYSGDSYNTSLDTINFPDNSTFNFANSNFRFQNTVTVTNHAEIPYDYFQGDSSGPTEVVAIQSVDQAYVAWQAADYDDYNQLPGNGYYYDANFASNTNQQLDVWGGSAYHYMDDSYYSTIRRKIGTSTSDSGTTTEPEDSLSTSTWFGSGGNSPVGGSTGTWNEGKVEKEIVYPLSDSGQFSQLAKISSAITRNVDSGRITFDRAHNTSYVEFRNIGGTTGNPTAGVNATYATNANIFSPHQNGLYHSSFFNGDEVHLEIVLRVYKTITSSTATGGIIHKYGYNKIKPQIQLYDGQTGLVDTNKFFAYGGSGWFYSNGEGYEGRYVFLHENSDDVGLNMDYDTYSSNTVDFDEIYETVDSSTSGWQSGHVDHILGATFKFVDPNQQNSDGSPNFSYTYDSEGNLDNGIEEVQVVDDLRIRVKNTAAPSSGNIGGTYQGSSSDRPLTRPLWEIKSIRVIKGYGVVDDFINPVEETYTFDDPTTPGVTETYTVSGNSLVDSSGATMTNAEFVDANNNPIAYPNSSGTWVLNYGDIQAYAGGVGSYSAIPGVTIPAWVEVQHNPIDEWDFDANVATGSGNGNGGVTPYTESKLPSWFGNNNLGNTVNTTLADGTSIEYKTPPGTLASGAQDWPFAKTSLGINTSLPQAPANNLPASPGSYNPQSITYNDVASGYWYINQDNGQNNSDYPIHCELSSGNHYVAGDWYFIDIEYDYDTATYPDSSSPPNVGNRPATGTNHDGQVYIPGVADHALFNSMNTWDVIDENGVGILGGGVNQAAVILIPIWRTEYGDERWVLRAIYQVHSNSYVNQNNHLNYFTLRFYNFKNAPLYVEKIISKKINYVSGTGTATNWDIGFGSGTYDQLHTFSDGVYNSATDDYSNVYYHSQKLCWENAYGDEGWSQKFQNVIPTTADTTPAQDPNWILKFTVGKNPKTGAEVGKLGVAVSNSIGDSINPGEFDGMIIKGLEVGLVGFYEITFGMNGADDGSASWDVVHSSSPNTSYTNYDAFDCYTNLDTATDSTYAEMIRFFNADTSNPLSANVSGITLTNQTQLFEGGTVASWNFDGFEPTIDDYIIWDGDNSTDGRIQFQNCPIFDPNSTGVTGVITANQLIDKPINRYEKYEISFTYKMADKVGNDGAGLLTMYYFNSEGYGFRINDIGDISNNNIVDTRVIDNSTDEGDGVRKVTMIVGIGDGSTTPPGYTDPWDTADSELGFLGVEALLNTFVIRRDGTDANSVTGWVDNISMKRHYDIEMTPGLDGILGSDDDTPAYYPTTVTFSESVNGWTSFKSFVPEAGLSLSKKYFTLKNAALYQHYVPANGATAANAENYNTFYGAFDELIDSSTIKTVLNAEPSVVKTFNTLNYEGSQAHVTKPISATDQFGNSTITINNAKAWSSGSNIDGWKVTEVKTDMDNGDLQSFIKKEGKWFGYIKGKHVVAGALDTSRFSVQGIGFADQVNVFDDAGLLVTTTTTTTGTGTGTSIPPSPGGGTGGGGGTY